MYVLIDTIKQLAIPTLKLILFLIIGFMIVVSLFIAYLIIQENIYVQGIQPALDRECGVNSVLQSSGSYTNDPHLSWGNGEAECDFNGRNNEWECECSYTPRTPQFR
jgi:hypothetical protein